MRSIACRFACGARLSCRVMLTGVLRSSTRPSRTPRELASPFMAQVRKRSSVATRVMQESGPQYARPLEHARVDEEIDQRGVEQPVAGLHLQNVERALGGHGAFVGSVVRRERVVDVGD